MTATLTLRRVGPGGEPAAMVATWMMGELTGFPDVKVQFTHPDAVTLEIVSAPELDRLRARIMVLLGEPRFARWAVLTG